MSSWTLHPKANSTFVIFKMKKSIQFGPNGSVMYIHYKDWQEAAKEKDLLILPVSSGPIAQSKKTGACMGAWFNVTNKGWMIGKGE